MPREGVPGSNGSLLMLNSLIGPIVFAQGGLVIRRHERVGCCWVKESSAHGFESGGIGVIGRYGTCREMSGLVSIMRYDIESKHLRIEYRVATGMFTFVIFILILIFNNPSRHQHS